MANLAAYSIFSGVKKTALIPPWFYSSPQTAYMFNNVAVDVFIGLIFIFLLYSLLASIIMEFIAHALHLRPRLLVKALRRMLEDNPKAIFGTKTRWTLLDFVSDVKESIKRFFYPFRNLPLLERFYQHPTVKYLGESKSASKPSYMKAQNFSQTVIQILRGPHYQAADSQMAAISNYLFYEAPAIVNEYKRYEHWVLNWDWLVKEVNKEGMDVATLKSKLVKFRDNPVRYKTRRALIDLLIQEVENKDLDQVKERMAELTDVVAKLPKKISPDTLIHFQNLFKDAQYDLDRFRLLLENWFNETMDRATGWYKRQTQIILLVTGFVIAIIANVDSIKLYKILARDKKVREQMVNMAVQSQGKYSGAVDTLRQRTRDSTVRRDTGSTVVITKTIVATTGDSVLDATYKILQKDIATSESILGLGWCSSDSCKAYERLLDSVETLKDELAALKDSSKDEATVSQKESQIAALSMFAETGRQKFKNKWNGWSLMGWLITALAISLGAPFWFDMLNKIMKLRGTGNKTELSTTSAPSHAATGFGAAPVVVTTNAQTGEEAVG